MRHDRRTLLLTAAGAGLGSMALMASQAWGGPAKKAGRKKQAADAAPEEEPNSPPEDLMLDHAVAERLLLIYQEGTRRMRAKESVDARVFHETAELVRKVVEDYHQKREEAHILGQFGEHAELAALAKTLREQHGIARKLTDKILEASTAERFAGGDGRRVVGLSCEAYVRMYRPHMAMESTELFQTLYEVVPEKKLDNIAAQFQKLEQQTFDEGGLDKVLADVERLEKELHIDTLESYAPQDA